MPIKTQTLAFSQENAQNFRLYKNRTKFFERQQHDYDSQKQQQNHGEIMTKTEREVSVFGEINQLGKQIQDWNTEFSKLEVCEQTIALITKKLKQITNPSHGALHQHQQDSNRLQICQSATQSNRVRSKTKSNYIRRPLIGKIH